MCAVKGGVDDAIAEDEEGGEDVAGEGGEEEVERHGPARPPLQILLPHDDWRPEE